MSLLSHTKLLTLSGMALTAAFAWQAEASERSYFRAAEGNWSGAGSIIAGPYKNTRFTCRLAGTTAGKVGMDLSGTCRVGLFSQPMSARVTKSGKGYRGAFLDGAKGKGLDIVGGTLRGTKLQLNIRRKQLNGVMVARMKDSGTMNITISVKVNRKLVPFITLGLKKRGGARRTSLLSD